MARSLGAEFQLDSEYGPETRTVKNSIRTKPLELEQYGGIPGGIELTFLRDALVRLVNTFNAILKFIAVRRQDVHDLKDDVRAAAERERAMYVLADPKFVGAHAIIRGLR